MSSSLHATAGKDMLREKALISHIGLTSREVAVVRSIFSLVRSLQEAYDFVDTSKAAWSHVVFVNADDDQALAEWGTVAHANKIATPVLVTARDDVEGTEIILKRPLALKKLVEVLQAITSTHVEKASGSKTHREELQILVVDDSFPVRKYMEHKLPQLAPDVCSIDFAETGEEAQLKLEHKNYEIVFLDVVMPGIDGYKLCKWIKAKHASYVVMLTSKKSPFDRVRGTISGCDNYLTKPPEDERLKAILQERLDTHARSQSQSSVRREIGDPAFGE